MDGGRLAAVVSDPPPSPSNFPRDILVEILKRLPAKTLMKFKCVSKDWFNLIRDPSMAESHFNHARTRPDASHLLFAFFAMDNQIQTIFPTNKNLFLSSQLPSHIFDEDFQPCSNVVNGLVCVCSVRSMQPRVWVLNLTTTEKKALPLPPSLAAKNYYCVPNFCRSIFYLGFDSDPVSNKYKILHNYNEAYEVLTLGTQTWRQVRGNPAADIGISLNGREGFIFQGIGHEGMASINGRIYIKNLKEEVISFFDLKEEKFGEVDFPESIEGVNRYTDLADFGGKLAVVVGKHEIVRQLRIWILEDYDNNYWVEKRLTLPNYNNHLYVEFMGVIDNDKVIVNCKKSSCFDVSPSYFLYYDLKTLERTKRSIIMMQPH
ncbi:PREDICTED: putative F-box protein At1g32420 [Ipomoea nil]|uniref:putative F-box protein At1g32420 n=1 Tax=Ipomoea nil TaxID=35883 RepID=UPI000900EDFB|nr:PREDICTED: putative F-box protein At1g32420 [Ipomoea nil]